MSTCSSDLAGSGVRGGLLERSRREDRDAGLAAAHLPPQFLAGRIAGDPGCLGPLEEDQEHVAGAVAVKDRLRRKIPLEGVAVLYSGDLPFELLAQVGQALLFGRAPGGFIVLGEGSLLFRSHRWFGLSG
jgi:hypothetical protein